MCSRPDISIITPSSNPKFLTYTVDAIRRQKYSGFTFESIIIQEAEDFTAFNHIRYASDMRIVRQLPHFDCGSAAKDVGISIAAGRYVIFWDDDNLYYENALQTVYENLVSDLVIFKVRYQGTLIPISRAIIPGEIDTMCLCVDSELAKTVPWSDGHGRYSDYRWASRIAQIARIHYSDAIIGEHL